MAKEMRGKVLLLRAQDGSGSLRGTLGLCARWVSAGVALMEKW